MLIPVTGTLLATVSYPVTCNGSEAKATHNHKQKTRSSSRQVEKTEEEDELHLYMDVDESPSEEAGLLAWVLVDLVVDRTGS